MKLHTPLLASMAIALCALSASASAQENFPDVPANHWAFQALETLKKDGLLVGYPNGTFLGSRPASRYEIAVAFNAAYVKLKTSIDGLTTQIAAAGAMNPNDISNIKDAVAKLQDELAAMKGYGQAIADLKRASATFELELEHLGVNVEAMKKDLGDLESRVINLEKQKPPIEVHGDASLWFGAGTSRGGYYGLNKDGRIVGTNALTGINSLFPPVANSGGFEKDSTFLHESAFTVSGTNEKGPKWQGTVVVTDMLGNLGAGTVAFGNQSDVFNLTNANSPVSGLLGYAPGTEDIYLQDGSVELGNDKNFVEAGRLGYSMNPYMLQRIDNTNYFANERWDNGKYYFDGALASGTAGFANLTVFAGRNSGLKSMNGVEINPLTSGPIGGFLTGDPTVSSGVLNFDRSLGADLKLAVTPRANINLGYLLLESDTDSPISLLSSANHVTVYGADADFRWSCLKIEGGAHKSDIQQQDRTVAGRDNSAWNIKASMGHASYGVEAEWREVEANYVAPGDWGRLGVLSNPSNIKGLRVGGHVDFLKKFSLEAHGTFDSGLSNTYAPTTFLGTGTNVRGYDVRLNYNMNNSLSFFAQLENTHIQDLAAVAGYSGSGDPNYKWTTFGMGYHLNANAMFNLQYEMSDIDNDYQVSGGGNFHGGFLTSQVTLKF